MYSEVTIDREDMILPALPKCVQLHDMRDFVPPKADESEIEIGHVFMYHDVGLEVRLPRHLAARKWNSDALFSIETSTRNQVKTTSKSNLHITGLPNNEPLSFTALFQIPV